MSEYYFEVKERIDGTAYSEFEKYLTRTFYEANPFDMKSVLEKKLDESEDMICSGEAARECLLYTLNRPAEICKYIAKPAADEKPKMKAFSCKWQPDEALFGKIAGRCSKEALDHFVRYQGRVGDCGVFWDKLLTMAEEVTPQQPMPENVGRFFAKTNLVFFENPLDDNGIPLTKEEEMDRAVTQYNDPTELMLLHRCRPDYRMEPEGAKAVLRTAIFLRFRAYVRKTKSTLSDKMFACWRALAPEPHDTTPVDEFFRHYTDEEFEKEIRGEILS